MSYLGTKYIGIPILCTFIAVLWSNYADLTLPWQKQVASTQQEKQPYTCQSQTYSTEIISVDPMVIYISNFTTQEETEGLLDAGEGKFRVSEVLAAGRKLQTMDRTSTSAGLPKDNEFVLCVLARARKFMGTMLSPQDDFGIPQLVRYESEQKYDLHHDWYERPQRLDDGRVFNRIASFFVYLQDNCTKGETHFPFLTGPTVEYGDKERFYSHTDGGFAFKPITGNALFWMNLMANETGDMRVVHAGLPIGEGTKTAMNIWPRKFY